MGITSLVLVSRSARLAIQLKIKGLQQRMNNKSAKFVVGLTGGIGSGKTTVANFFNELGVDIVDADIVAREVVEPGSLALSEIADHFGKGFINESGQLNRTLLRTRVFNNEQDKKWLNNLLHPLIRESITTQLNACKSPYCLLVAPLLIENGLHHIVDSVLVVDVSENTQVERTSKRDPSSRAEVARIIASQISRNKRVELADDILLNEDADLTTMKDNVYKLHQKYLHLAQI